MEINIFWGDLSDISAKTATLVYGGWINYSIYTADDTQPHQHNQCIKFTQCSSQLKLYVANTNENSAKCIICQPGFVRWLFNTVEANQLGWHLSDLT